MSYRSKLKTTHSKLSPKPVNQEIDFFAESLSETECRCQLLGAVNREFAFFISKTLERSVNCGLWGLLGRERMTKGNF